MKIRSTENRRSARWLFKWGGPRNGPPNPSHSDTPRGTRGAPRSPYPELGQLGVGRLARLRVPAGHFVVGLTRGEEFVGIDPAALYGAVADALVHALGQHVVRRGEALPVVEHARQRVVPLAHLHQLVAAKGPAGCRVGVVRRHDQS